MLKDPYRPLPDQVAPSEDDRGTADQPEAYVGQSERRLSLRLLAYWRHLREEREFAARGKIDPTLIPEMWPFSFILDVSQESDAARFLYVGDEIARISGVSTDVKSFAELPENTLLAKSSSYFEQVLRRRCPITIGGEFVDPYGVEILYRSVMLPLSDDDTTIVAILGAGNCKEK
jgi:hypothetical protein